MYEVETREVGNYTVRFFQDDNPWSPLEWDLLGHVSFFHRDYDFSYGRGKTDGSTPERLREIFEDEPCVIVPIHMYEHSGIGFTAGSPNRYPFNCPFDGSPYIGYAWITYAEIREEFKWKRLTKERKERIAGYLCNQIEALNQYVSGDVYGYVVEDPFGEHVSSCWGFYGWKYAKEAILSEAYSVIGHDIMKHKEFDIPFPITGG